MNDQPVINITQNTGCLTGCWTFFWGVVAIGLVLTYPLVAVPIIVVMVVGLVWLRTRQPDSTPVLVTPPPQPTTSGVDVERLRKLGELRSAGHLSEEEFERLKAETLEPPP